MSDTKSTNITVSDSNENSNGQEEKINISDDKKLSSIQASAHLFKDCVGVGLFAMGDCFKNGGLIGGTILLPIIAFITVHCQHMIIKCSILAVEKTPGATFYDYPETIEKCFEYGPKRFRNYSKAMKLIVKAFLCVMQFGFCATYFIFMTINLYQVIIQNGIDISINTCMAICLLPAMIPSLITNFKHIAPISLGANFVVLLGLIATLTITFKTASMPPLSELTLFTNGSQMSLFFGTVLYSFDGIAVVLPLRNAMKKPEKFSSRFGVLNVTIFLVALISMLTGIISYLYWGEKVDGSITLNIDSTKVISQVTKIISALGVFYSYPVKFMVLIQMIWKTDHKNECIRKCPQTIEICLRILMVILTFLAALAIPNVSFCVSLIGALCATAISLFFPILADLCIRSQLPEGLNVWICLKNFLIVMLAILGTFSGTYKAISSVIK